MRSHASPFAIRGVADVIGVVSGRFVAFEVKDKSTTSKFQDAWIKKAQEHGGLIAVVHGVDEVESQLRSWNLIP